MASILIYIKDLAKSKKVIDSLLDYQVISLPENFYEQYKQEPDKVISQLSSSNAELIIMDYEEEDAVSVKIMQEVKAKNKNIEFIFLENFAISHGHLLMVFNEGAKAVLQADYDIESLLIQVKRVFESANFLFSDKDDEDLEDQASAKIVAIKDLNKKYQNLVSYLLVTPESQQNRRLLLVSDSAYQLELMKKHLEDYNFSVSISLSFEEAVDIALKEKPAVVVSDFELSSKSGLELCKELKFVHKLIPCYFIICTANEEREKIIMVPGNGVDDYLLKPGAYNDFSEFISKVAVGLTL